MMETFTLMQVFMNGLVELPGIIGATLIFLFVVMFVLACVGREWVGRVADEAEVRPEREAVQRFHGGLGLRGRAELDGAPAARAVAVGAAVLPGHPLAGGAEHAARHVRGLLLPVLLVEERVVRNRRALRQHVAVGDVTRGHVQIAALRHVHLAVVAEGRDEVLKVVKEQVMDGGKVNEGMDGGSEDESHSLLDPQGLKCNKSNYFMCFFGATVR